MENASLSDALISLIPTYGPWIIFGIVALESAGVPLPGETIQAALRVALSRADHLFQLSNLALPGRYLLAADRSWRKAAAAVTYGLTWKNEKQEQQVFPRRASLSWRTCGSPPREWPFNTTALSSSRKWLAAISPFSVFRVSPSPTVASRALCSQPRKET